VSSGKVAVITGITGQDGAYLAQHLLKNNYIVVGFVRSSVNVNVRGLTYLGISENIILEECDLLDMSQLIKLFSFYKPSEVYNLAAQSSVSLSFKQPIGTFSFNTISVFNILETIRLLDSNIKFYQASSSEMYGRVNHLPVTEESTIHPVSPYAISKAAAHWACINYRESYGIHASCGILFNHESYLRGASFFIKKILHESILISKGKLDILRVGNIDICRDFGFAPSFVRVMHALLQEDKADDYIICSGSSISLRAVIEYVFFKLGISTNKIVVEKELFRPNEIIDMYGDPFKAKDKLRWNYDLNSFQLIDLLLEEELLNSNR
jgi:GDPmannose 4,6-dehydratase